VALLMAVESILRLLDPVQIRFNEAIAVALLGLIVNVISAFLLQDGHPEDHRHGSDHHHHPDHNLKAAYLHVLADALTSVLAIIALFTGKFFGWVWMDPMMGIVGAILISRWSYGLLRDTSRILLDTGVKGEERKAILYTIESDSDNRVCDFHIWPLGSHTFAAVISIVTHFPKPPEHYKALLSQFTELQHVTIEVNEADSGPCLPQAGPGHPER
jgi:cation diffusion facilitator family transporter